MQIKGTGLVFPSGNASHSIQVAVGAASSARALVPLRAMLSKGDRAKATPEFVVNGSIAGGCDDTVARSLSVLPQGFPVEVSFGGQVELGGTLAFEFEVPANVIPGSLVCNATILGSPVSMLSSALENLIRQPCGCFEQVRCVVAECGLRI